MRNRHLILLLIVLVSITSCSVKDKEASYYTNPVIAGEIPDPSVIRVGDTYYAAGTSFDFAPNYPVYESKDLVNWKQIGFIFNAPPDWSSDNFWAPELFYKDGTFYVYYTCKRKDTRVACIGVATTKNIYEGFTDHGIIIEWGEEAIDAFVFQDDDEKLYITWKAYGLTAGRPIEILASELSEDGLELIGDHFTLTDPSKEWKPGNDEGQVLMKHGKYYYLFYSDGGCCDNKCDYKIRVARSENLKEGWKQKPEPIIEGGDTWVCSGHGTIVTTPDGRYYYLYHAYHIEDFEYIGRQGLLDELAWDAESGWPYFVQGKAPSEKAPMPFEGTRQIRDSVKLNYFATNEELKLREWDLHFPRPVVKLEGSTLRVEGSHSGSNFLGFRPETGNYSFQCKAKLNKHFSGIGIYTNDAKMLALAASENEIRIIATEGGEERILDSNSIQNLSDIYLKYTLKKGKFMEFWWSEDGEVWKEIQIDEREKYDASFLATWGYSPRAGLIWEGELPTLYSEAMVQYYFR